MSFHRFAEKLTENSPVAGNQTPEPATRRHVRAPARAVRPRAPKSFRRSTRLRRFGARHPSPPGSRPPKSFRRGTVPRVRVPGPPGGLRAFGAETTPRHPALSPVKSLPHEPIVWLPSHITSNGRLRP